jgi:hypothetical protein
MKYQNPRITSMQEAVPAIRGLNRKVFLRFLWIHWASDTA